jgi:uncharacterized membrane protein YfcA
MIVHRGIILPLLIAVVVISAIYLFARGGTAFNYALLLFLFSFGIGIISIVAGVGGGVLFVPLVSALFPFHMDFVRGASLFVALSGSLTASSPFLHTFLASPRLVFPLALISSIASIGGAIFGLSISEGSIRILLGILMFVISVVMVITKRSEISSAEAGDRFSHIMGISGKYYENTLGREVNWRADRTLLSMVLFIVIGFLSGMFGIGAGWANVPVINLIMGIPLKVAVGSSLFIISIGSTASSWVYLNAGAVLPVIAVPSVLGMIIGSKIGAHILWGMKPVIVRTIVILLLALSGAISLLRGCNLL